MPDTVSPTAIPFPVKLARITLFAQGALLVFGTVALGLVALDLVRHGQDVEPFDHFALLITLVQAALLLWCGFRIRRGSARLLAIVVESISLAAVLFSLITTGALSLVGIVLPGCVILLLTRPDTRNWYAAENQSPPAQIPEPNGDQSP